MSVLDEQPEVDTEPGPPVVAPSRRRRSPAPKANPFWRFVFPLLVLGAGLAVFLLWRSGTKSVLDSTDGREVELVTDPAAPGYEAFVDPTPTMLIAHTDDGELVGVTVLARTALDGGGAGVLLAADLLVVLEADGAEDVQGAENAEFLAVGWDVGGIDRLEFLVEQLFGFGFTERMELDVDGLTVGLGFVDPIPYLLSDQLVTPNPSGSVDVWLTPGRKDLEADVAARLYGFRNPAEADANRVLRQRRIWDTWIESIARADDPDVATLPFDVGLPPYLRAFAFGAYDLEIVPMDPVRLEPGDPPFYVVEESSGREWLAARSLEMVPLPVSTKSAVRPTVRLLDGTGDPSNRDRSSVEVVAAGGVVTIIGNSEVLGLARTTVVYHRPEVEEQATTVATALGVEAEFVDDVEQPADLTVTIGLDRVAS